MVVKGSGLFKDASDAGSAAGLTLFGGVGVMLIGDGAGSGVRDSFQLR